jgi:hypothetical protein
MIDIVTDEYDLDLTGCDLSLLIGVESKPTRASDKNAGLWGRLSSEIPRASGSSVPMPWSSRVTCYNCYNHQETLDLCARIPEP